MTEITLIKKDEHNEWKPCLYLEKDNEELKMDSGAIMAAISPENTCIIKEPLNPFRKIIETCLRDSSVRGIILEV